MIATPSYDGKVDAWYSNSVLMADRACRDLGIELDPIYVCYDAIVSKARNDLFAYAFRHDFDELVYVDADIAWGPDQLLKLLSHPVDVVGGIYPKKTPQEDYPVNFISDKIKLQDGLLEVASLPTGFLRISKQAIKIFWEKSSSYTVNKENEEYKMVFEPGIVGGRFISEDIIFCLKWREWGYKVYLDPYIKLSHIGPNVYSGNIVNFMKNNFSIDL